MGDPEDESLSEWAHRRAARLRPVGERRAVTLGMGRLSAAARYHRGQLRRRATPPERPPTWLPEPDRMPPTRSPMAPGTGRHRKP
ncbi:DUF6087 family protein [Streptomyces echinatus]|uniref:DUF6087 family protein n=1 Tax=Streptomyces echinatus TaxID=67293 RepID=UPI0037A86103